MEIQKELKALTKELRPKKKKEKMDELEEEEKEEEKVEPKDKNDVLESYHKEKKRYAEVKAAKPIPKQKASDTCSCPQSSQLSFDLTRPAERSRPWLYSPSLSRNCLGSNMATMMRKKTMRLRRLKKMTKRPRMMRRSLETTG